MKRHFNDFEQQEKENIVQIMRAQAQFEHKKSKSAWVKAAEIVNPYVISLWEGIQADMIIAVAQEAGEEIR